MADQIKKDLGTVVVIGGCGFLGHHVVNQLVEMYNCKVAVIDIRTLRNRRPKSDGVSYYDGDMTNLEALTGLFEKIKPNVVIHTASPIAVAETPNEFLYKVNVLGTKNVITACQTTGVTALVYTSSASVISDSVTDLINADERWPILRGANQTDYYAETKAAAEELVIEANRSGPKNSLFTACIRPAGIFGEGDVQLVPPMMDLLFTGKTNFQVGTNDNLFDFTYVGNVAHAHLLAASILLQTAKMAIAPLDHEKVDGEAFIVTNDSPVYFWDFPRQLWALAGHEAGTEGVWTITKGVGIPLATISENLLPMLGRKSKLTRRGIKFSCMTRYYSCKKAKERLGYRPLVAMKDAMSRSVEDHLESRKKGELRWWEEKKKA